MQVRYTVEEFIEFNFSNDYVKNCCLTPPQSVMQTVCTPFLFVANSYKTNIICKILGSERFKKREREAGVEKTSKLALANL